MDELALARSFDYIDLRQVHPHAVSFGELQAIAAGDVSVASAPPIVFVHVPRSAGTTMDYIAAQNIRQIFHVRAEHPNDWINKDVFYFVTDPRVNPRMESSFFTGHLSLANKLFQFFPGNYLTLSLLRDPIERIASHYYFHRDSPPNHFYDVIHDENLSLVQYVQRFHSLIPTQRSYFWDSEDVKQQTVAVALDNLNGRVTLFGLTESFDEFLCLIRHLIGWKKLFYTRRNVSTHQAWKGRLSREEYGFLYEFYREEIEFYRQARELYSQRRSVLDKLDQDLEDLRHLNHSIQNLLERFNDSRATQNPLARCF